MSRAAKNYTADTVLEAIRGSGAIVSTVAKRLGCQWITARKYIQNWESTKQAMLDEQETILDMAESKLYEAIQNGNTQDARWLLSRKGKSRGFAERWELEHSGEIDSKITIEVVRADHPSD